MNVVHYMYCVCIKLISTMAHRLYTHFDEQSKRCVYNFTKIVHISFKHDYNVHMYVHFYWCKNV